jgi:phosphoribosylamine-glycine ligase
MAAARGGLGKFEAKWSPGASVSIVIASEGYPGDPRTGRRIDGLDEAGRVPGSVVLHAGTRREGSSYYTSGGRVLVASARGETLAAACRVAYDAASRSPAHTTAWTSVAQAERSTRSRRTCRRVDPEPAGSSGQFDKRCTRRDRHGEHRR